MLISQRLGQWPRRLGLSLACGLLSGSATAAFLASLDWITNFRIGHPVMLWLLPIGGLGIGWIFHQFGARANSGISAVLDEINTPTTPLPIRMAPMILGGTLLTHLVGGSAGREGTSVQMGAALSDQLSRIMPLSADERRRLLIAGAGAGFGAAIGTPMAGAIFGMEFRQIGRFRPIAIVDAVIASVVATATVGWWGVYHTPYPRFNGPFNLKYVIATVIAGVGFGLAARLFITLSRSIQRVSVLAIHWPPFRPMIGGIILAILMIGGHLSAYAGLGLPIIFRALDIPADGMAPIIKLGMTALTVGTGFKGGEFIPLVFIGTTLGSALSTVMPGTLPVLSRTGFAAVFGAAANTPLACSIMAIELFGLKIAPYAIVGCFVAYYVSGNQGIYISKDNHG